MVDPERALWRAAVGQAFKDAAGIAVPQAPCQWKWGLRRQRLRKKRGKPPNTRSELMDAWDVRIKAYRNERMAALHDRDVARAWLAGSVPGVKTIAPLAGLEPEFIFRKAAELAAAGWVLRNPEQLEVLAA